MNAREDGNSGQIENARLSLWQAAYIIARRDFQAVLFSKAFLFFMLVPIFFLGISGGAGMLGAKAADMHFVKNLLLQRHLLGRVIRPIIGG